MKDIKQFFKSLFSDSEFDADASKVMGVACIICGLVGFFMSKENFQFVFLSGCALIGWKAKVEGV